MPVGSPPDEAWRVAVALPQGPSSAEECPPPGKVVASEVTSLSPGFGALPRPLTREPSEPGAQMPPHPAQLVAVVASAWGGGGGSATDPPSEHDEFADAASTLCRWSKSLTPPSPTPGPGSAWTPWCWGRGVQIKNRPPVPL